MVKSAKIRKGGQEERHVVEQIKPPSLWNVYCAVITFWCPDFVLKGLLPQGVQGRAARLAREDGA